VLQRENDNWKIGSLAFIFGPFFLKPADNQVTAHVESADRVIVDAAMVRS
jgi:hypothetical protein